MSSLLKYRDAAAGRTRNREMHFARSNIDGMPFRGDPNHLLREEEYEELTEVVCDTWSRLFDLSDKKQNRRYERVLEKFVAGWYLIHERETKMVEQKDGTVKVFVHMTFSRPVRELNRSRASSFVPVS